MFSVPITWPLHPRKIFCSHFKFKSTAKNVGLGKISTPFWVQRPHNFYSIFEVQVAAKTFPRVQRPRDGCRKHSNSVALSGRKRIKVIRHLENNVLPVKVRIRSKKPKNGLKKGLNLGSKPPNFDDFFQFKCR